MPGPPRRFPEPFARAGTQSDQRSQKMIVQIGARSRFQSSRSSRRRSRSHWCLTL